MRIAFCILLWAMTAGAANLFVPLSDLTQQPERNTRVTLTPLDGVRNIGGALVTVRPVARFTDASGHVTFTNVVYGRYRMDAAGTPSSSWTFHVPETNITVNVTTLIGVTPAPPEPTNYWTAFQTDQAIQAAVGSIEVGPGTITNFGALASASLYVAPDGNNTTGSRTDPTKPFATPSAAQAAALPGDTVIVTAGYYSATNLGADYVSWYLDSGATLSAGNESVFGVTNSTLWITGAGAVTNTTLTNVVLRMHNSSVRVEGVAWRGAVWLTGTNLLTFSGATIETGDAAWIYAESADSVVVFNNTRVPFFPISEATLQGSLIVQ
jgi:hypothetical protein